MRNLEYIHGRIKAMEISDPAFKQKLFGTKKEVNELQTVLKDNEELDFIVSGSMDGNTWLVSITSLRLIFLDKGMLFGLKQKDVMLDKVNSINMKKGLILAKIFIEDGSGKTLIIDNLQKPDATRFVDILNDNINVFKNNLYKPTPEIRTIIQEAPKVDLVEKIKELASLKEQGFLTDEEFVQAKVKLLS